MNKFDYSFLSILSPLHFLNLFLFLPMYFSLLILLLSVLFVSLRDHFFSIYLFLPVIFFHRLLFPWFLSFFYSELRFAQNWPFRIRDVRELRPKRASSAFVKSAEATVKCSCGNGRQHSRNVDRNINRVFALAFRHRRKVHGKNSYLEGASRQTW